MAPDDAGAPPRASGEPNGAPAAPTAVDLGFDRLKQRHRQVRQGFDRQFDLRLHRTLSWLGRAEMEPDDPDARFLFLWIAFNAAYGERDGPGERPREREAFAAFLSKLIDLDTERRIEGCLCDRFSGQVGLLIGNRYVFGPFWSHQHGFAGYETWEQRHAGACRVHALAEAGRDTRKLLSLLFHPLYILRNQLIHGGATWNSSLNRHQVEDGAEILGALVPITAELMMEHPDEDWGPPGYPSWET